MRSTHCIFDLDGLLIDTEPIYTRVTDQILEPFGVRLEPELKARLMGRKSIDSARLLVETLGVDLAPEEYLERRTPLLHEHFRTCESLPGAEELIRALHRRGVPIALATSSRTIDFEAKATRHHAWLDLMSTRVLGDDPAVRRGKPAPDIFLEAARRLDAPPERCLVFEDAPNGVEAARAAGMRVVWVPGPLIPDAEDPGSDLRLESLEEFVAADWIEGVG